MLLSFLQTFGLNKTESDLYELLLKLGEVPASILVEESKLKRPTVYNAMKLLQKKGLVTYSDVNKKLYFRPEPPSKLLNIIEEQYQTLGRAKDTMQGILPQLTSSYVLSVEKPVIRMYEGVEGLKKAHLEILAEKKEILAYVSVNAAIDEKFGNFWKKYYAIRKRDNITVRAITPNTKDGVRYKQQDKDQLRKTRLVPVNKFPFAIEKDIVGNKVAFFSTQREKLIITLIDNKEIADAERAIFELAWEQAEHYDKLAVS